MFAAWINLKTLALALGDQRGLRVRDLIDEAAGSGNYWQPVQNWTR